MIRFSLPVVILLVLTGSSYSLAEDGLRFRSFNPFGDPAAEVAQEAQPQVIGLPPFRQDTGSEEEDSFFQRIGDGTRTTFQRVGTAMRSPFQQMAASRRGARGESQGWFQLPWNRDDAETRRPETVGEFMRQDRPRF